MAIAIAVFLVVLSVVLDHKPVEAKTVLGGIFTGFLTAALMYLFVLRHYEARE